MRMYSVKTLYDKTYKTFAFSGIWEQAMGTPETRGCWLIWGPEKNGKTSMALMLAEYLSSFTKVVYMSAEEGLGKTFTDACKRVNLQAANSKLKFVEYTPIEVLKKQLKQRQSPQIIFIDNITVYAKELKFGGLHDLLRAYPNKLFIFLAHEENKQPYTSTAKVARKLAQIIMHIEGLAAQVSGRCPGGNLYIDETKAKLYWGDAPEETNQESNK